MQAKVPESARGGVARRPAGAAAGAGRRGWALAACAAALLAAALGLRTAALDIGWFGIDQARDVATALDVAAGRDLPTVGPTMRRIVRLGALYHYFWALPHLVSRDPLAAYWFAAALGVVAVVGVWRLAARLWGEYPALAVLAVAAVHPVWVIDGRVAWAPAALPAAGAGLLWLALARPGAALSPGRAALTGAVLGLAVQLHLTMLVWAVALAAVALLERLPARVLLAGAAGGLATGLPAVAALLGASEHDAGLGGLEGGGTLAAVAGRALRALLLPWRVPAAFAGWDGEPGGLGAAIASACVVLGAAGVLGLLRLVLVAPRARATRLLAAVVAAAGLVVAAPGEVWWYYLDALLPAWALAAGGLLAPAVGVSSVAPAAVPAGGRVRGVVLAVVLGAALVVALHLGGWLRLAAARGFTPIDPALLTLDARPGADASARGRLVAVGVKRELALLAARAVPAADFGELWRRLHGPAFEDATGDHGFWMRWARARAGRAGAPGPVPELAIWYADDPEARAVARARPPGPVPPAGGAGRAEGGGVARVGPLLIAVYAPALDYGSCRAGGAPVVVPVRAVPHPKRYGDGRPLRPAALPARLECALAPGAGAVRVVARLEGPGTVRVATDGAAGDAGPASALCVARGPAPRAVRVEVALPPGATSALDLYDVPFGAGCGRDAEIAARSGRVL